MNRASHRYGSPARGSGGVTDDRWRDRQGGDHLIAPSVIVVTVRVEATAMRCRLTNRVRANCAKR